MENGQLVKVRVLLGHGNVQYASGGLKGIHKLRYYLYMISEDMDLKDTMTSAYSDLMQRDLRNEQNFFLSDVDPLCISDEKDGADNTMCGNTSKVQMTGESDENSAMNLWPD